MPNVVTVTPAATPPVTTAELAAHLRIIGVDTSQQAELSRLIASAGEYIEAQTGRALASAAYRESFTSAQLRADPMVLSLLRGPVTAVTAVSYWPGDGSARVELSATPAAQLLPPLADMLPGALLLTADALELDLAERPDALAVTYTAAPSPACPAPLKQAIILLAALWFEERLPVAFASPSELPFGLQNLIYHHRVAGWCA